MKEVHGYIYEPGSPSGDGPNAPPWFCELRVFSPDQEHPVQIRGALFTDGAVEILDGLTPFQKNFKASTCVFVVEAVNRPASIQAELWSTRYGSSSIIASFAGGQSGYLIESCSAIGNAGSYWRENKACL